MFQYNRNNDTCSLEKRFFRLTKQCVTDNRVTSTCSMNGVSLDDVSFSQNPVIDDAVRVLYKQVLNGGRDSQRLIDSYIYAELLYRKRPTSIIYNSSTVKENIELLRSRDCDGIHAHSLPDIGNFIRSVVFFSGDKPCSFFDANMPLIACIYDALPNIKRTKQLKSKFEPLYGNGAQFSAIVSILGGALLGLFPWAAKMPYFKRRCDIVACLRDIQCLPETEKVETLRSIPNIIKLCFMEYVQFCIVEYMPVEYEVMKRGRTTRAFLNTLPGVCDIFRLQINDLEILNLNDIDRIAVHCIERCYRLCKFKMQRHAGNKANTLPFFKHVEWDTMSRALELVEYDHFLNSHKICGKMGGDIYDYTRDLCLTLPDTPQDVLKYACIMQQTLKTFKLPENVARKQALSLKRIYSHCQDSQKEVSRFYVCMGCILMGRGQKRTFRYSCYNDTVECARCHKANSIMAINMVGAIVYFFNSALVMCHVCLDILDVSVFDYGIDVGCRNCFMKSGEKKAECKQFRKKRKPCFHCCLPSSNILTLLESNPPIRMKNVYVCNKHTPPTHVQKYTHEVCAMCNVCLLASSDFFCMQVSQLSVWCGGR